MRERVARALGTKGGCAHGRAGRTWSTLRLPFERQKGLSFEVVRLYRPKYFLPTSRAKLPSDSRRRLNSISRSGFISSPAKKMHRRALLLTAQAGRRSPSSLARRTPPTDLSDAAMKERLADRSSPVDRPAAPAAPGSQLDRQTYRHYLLQKAPQDMTDPRQ